MNKFYDVMPSTLKARRESIVNEMLFALGGNIFSKEFLIIFSAEIT